MCSRKSVPCLVHTCAASPAEQPVQGAQGAHRTRNFQQLSVQFKGLRPIIQSKPLHIQARGDPCSLYAVEVKKKSINKSSATLLVVNKGRAAFLVVAYMQLASNSTHTASHRRKSALSGRSRGQRRPARTSNPRRSTCVCIQNSSQAILRCRSQNLDFSVVRATLVRTAARI